MTDFRAPFNHRAYAICAYLVHGHTPWGHHLAEGRQAPRLREWDDPTNGDDGWIMCCAHVLPLAEGELWLADGIGQVGAPDGRGGRLMIAGPRAGAFLDACWSAISGGYQEEAA